MAGSARSNRWLFGPAPDLLLGCGLLYALAFAVFAWSGGGLSRAQPGYLLPLLVILFSMPHYGGTLVRVYEDAAERHRYKLFAVWATVLVVALCLIATRDVFFGSLLFTLYATWSPWHYTGQNYGLSLMFLRRGGVAIAPGLKRWIYAAFGLSFALTFLVLHITLGHAYSAFDYAGANITFLPLGIPAETGRLLVQVVGAAYAVATLVAVVGIVRSGGFANLVPVVALMLTQALWFSAPYAVRHFAWETGLHPLDQQAAFRDYTLMIFVGHGIQYLWVTTFYARASSAWGGYGLYYAKVLLSGVAIWSLPFLLLSPQAFGGLSYDQGLALVVATGVNLHHFILDGAIWKLRNSRIAGVLIRSEAQAPEGAVRRGWVRPVVWGTCAIGLALGVSEWWNMRVRYPDQLRAGDVVGAAATLDRFSSTGYDRGKRRALVGSLLERREDLEGAARQYALSAELYPNAKVLVALGRVEEKRGDFDAASDAYRRALALDFERPDLLHKALGSLARRRGDCAGAVEHYRAGLRHAPGSRSRANDLAWTLATCPDPEARRPEESVRIAEEMASSGQPNANLLDTLAATYAAAGRFDDAVRTAAEAEQLAASKGDRALRDDIRRKLDLYRSGRPYVEPPSIGG